MLQVLNDPKADVAALQPLVDKAIAAATQNFATTIAPALSKALSDAFTGLTVTITISRR
jgi:hypothetical protein